MKRVTHRIAQVIAGVGLLLTAAVPRADAAVILIDPATRDVQVGQTFVLDVLVTGADDLFAYDIEVTFDNTILTALALLDGPFLSENGAVTTDGFLDFIKNSDGFVSGADSRQNPTPGADGDGRLFSIRFKAKAVGTSAIDFDLVCDAADPFCSEIRDSSDTPSSFDTVPGVVNVLPRAAPEPTLLALASLGLFAARARRLVRR